MPVLDSPFPGVDPYLQRRWGDVHSTLVTFVKEALQELLPTGLRARSEEQVLLEDEGGEPLRRWYRPDVALVGVVPPTPAVAYSGPDVEAGVIVVELAAEPEVDRWVKIIDTTAGNRVVTAIEVLSPANKRPGPLNRLYRRKLRDYARGSVNVVEVDLVSGSRTRLPVARRDLPADQRTPYLIAVRRAPVPERWVCYPVSLRRPIPPVRVPLRPADADVTLDLQDLLRRVYRAGGHDDIDYAPEPRPPLAPDDSVWADAVLRAAGRRP